MFPNLRVFINSYCNRPNKKYFNRPFEIAIPVSKVEEIEDSGECELARQLLLSVPCKHLRTLKVNLNVQNPRSNFFSLLKNLPTLQSLDVSGCAFGILDCEMIHDNVPSIRHLSLEDIEIQDELLPAEIIPATSVRKLNFYWDTCSHHEDDDYTDIHVRWYKYLSKKYTDLTEFDYDDAIIADQEIIDPNKEIYQEGLIPLYKNMGIRLKHLSVISAPGDIGLFDKLDSFGCQIQRIHFEYNYNNPLFSQLAESTQSNYVGEATLYETNITCPNLLENMTSLRSIDIILSSKVTRSDLTEYMNGFPPSLTEFVLTCSHMEITDLPTRLNNLKTLSIECLHLPQNLGQAVSSCCPKLTSISIIGGVANDMTFHLSHNHLEVLNITSYHNQDERMHGFLLKYANASHPLCFVEQPFHVNNSTPLIEFGTVKELKDRVVIEVECAYANDITFKTFAKHHDPL
jgi:hypothetical protein